jgi:hypothetical protein
MLSILEYSDVGSSQRGSLAIALEPPIASQSLDIGPTSIQSEPFHATTCIVKLTSDEDCLIDVGLAADATNSIRKLKAGAETTITVAAGSNMKIAAIATGNAAPSSMNSLEALLQIVGSPDALKARLETLSQATAKADAATAEHKAAAEATGWSGKLAEWDASLVQREKDLAAGQAQLQAKIDKLKALT